MHGCKSKSKYDLYDVPLITSRFSSVSTRCAMVDLGATNVAKTAPRTNTLAATAKISFLIDVGAALVWASGSSSAAVGTVV